MSIRSNSDFHHGLLSSLHQHLMTEAPAAALGNLLAGLVAGLIESLPLPQLFGTVGVISVGAGIVLALANGPLRRLAGDVR